MRRGRIRSASTRLVGVIAAGTALAALVAVEPANAAGTSVVPTAPSGPSSELVAVSLLSATDGWAVGSTSVNGLTERYTGSSFVIVPSANLVDHPGTTESGAGLTGVAAISPTNAIAVGTATTTSGPTTVTSAVAERWNGSKWIRTAVPNPGSTNSLAGVAATSATDAWAVGTSQPGATALPLAVHWNGTAWTQVATPAPGTEGNAFNGVAATSAHDAWAVGYAESRSSGVNVKHSLVEHWNGTAWSRVPSPDFAPDAQDTELTAVAAVSPNDVWAAGNGATSTTSGAVLLHFTGLSARKLAVPAERVGGVTVIGCDVWLSGSSAGTPIVARLHGSTWTVFFPLAPTLGSRVTLGGIAPNGSQGVIALGASHSVATSSDQPIALGVTP
jgi:hypothetical protein